MLGWIVIDLRVWSLPFRVIGEDRGQKGRILGQIEAGKVASTGTLATDCALAGPMPRGAILACTRCRAGMSYVPGVEHCSRMRRKGLGQSRGLVPPARAALVCVVSRAPFLANKPFGACQIKNEDFFEGCLFPLLRL